MVAVWVTGAFFIGIVIGYSLRYVVDLFDALSRIDQQAREEQRL